jgi:hypothetical protein
MKWQPGDVAIIDSRSNRGGEYCILRRRYEDEYGSNDYFYTERGKKRVIPCAWIVEVVNRRFDCCLVAEDVLMQAGHPNSQVEWADCVWQPVDYIKYP